MKISSKKIWLRWCKLFFFAINITKEKLEEYCCCKNDDLATLLLKRYYEFLDVFSKKKADTFLIQHLYNYAINIKDGYQLLSAIIYRMSRDKIQKLRQYLDENLAKKIIYASHLHATSLVLFVIKPRGGL